MSTTTLTAPTPAGIAGVHARPGLGRLVAVELRKMVNTRAGFWLQAAMVVLMRLLLPARDGSDRSGSTACLRRTWSVRRRGVRGRRPRLG